MFFKIKNQENFWSGLMFIFFGIAAIVISNDYPMGSIMRMGPGYFPRVLGGITVFLGLIITLTAFKIVGPEIKPFAWRGIIMLAVGFLIFGWAVEHVGFIPALAAMIVCHALAGSDFKLWQTLAMMAVLVIGCTVLFIYGLELPFPLFCWR